MKRTTLWRINSLTLKCLERNTFHTVLMCLLRGFLITMFYVIVLMFRLNFTSGPMLGYTIFCHLSVGVLRSNIGLYYSAVRCMGSVGSFVLRVSLGMSAMWWYFATVFHLLPDACLSPHMTSLQVICMEYMLALYPLFLLIITYVCIELHAWNFRLVIYRLCLSCHCCSHETQCTIVCTLHSRLVSTF